MQTSKISFRIVTLILAATLITACTKETRKARLLAEADDYFKSGNYDKAKVTYLNALRLDPANAVAFERIGAMWQDDGAPLRAGAFLARAIVLDPSNVQNRIRLARCYVGTGQFADGKKEALKVLEQAPDNGDAIITLTEAARGKEDIEAAEEQLQKFPKKNDVSFYLASANLFFSKADPAAAGNALQQALTVDPKSSAAHLAMGNLHLFQKDQKQAGEEFKTAADLAPVRSIERLKYAEFKWGTGDADEVRRLATEMTKQAPDYLPGWIWLAELGYKDKKYDEALSLLENVFGRDPEYIEGRRLESDVLLAKGDKKKALQVLERLDQTYPDVPLIKYQLARAYLADNNMNQAAVALDQAVSINPDYDDAVLLLGQVNLATGHGDKVIEPMSRLLRKRPDLTNAALLLAGGHGSLDRFDDAAAVLNNQAQLTPNDPQPQLALGLTLRRAKRNDEARQAFEKAAQLSPDNLFLLDQLVELDLLEKHFDAARERIRRQFQKMPDSPSAHFWEGKILAGEEKWDSAQAELQKTLQLDPTFGAAYDFLIRTYIASNKLPQAVIQFHLGMTAYMMGQTDLARAAFKKAASAPKDFPDKDESKRRLVLLESGTTGSQALSVVQLEEMTKQQPNDVIAQMRLGEAYEKQGGADKAAAAFEQAVKVNPKLTAAITKLAQLNAGPLQNKEKAHTYAKKARELAPADHQIAGIAGKVAYQGGNFTWSYSLLQEGVRQRQNDPSILYNLAWAAYSLGKVNEARDVMQKALANNPDSAQAADAKKFLALTALEENPK